MAKNDTSELEGSTLSERATPSDRSLKRWKKNSVYVAVLFSERNNEQLTKPEIKQLVRATYHYDRIPGEYSERAVDAVLWRFTRKGYIRRIKQNGLYRYAVTDFGLGVFLRARRLHREQADQMDRRIIASSHTPLRVPQLEPSSSHTKAVGLTGHETADDLGEEALIGLMTKEFSQLFGRTWFEKGALNFKVDHWLAEQIGQACPFKPKTKRGSYRAHERDFSLSIWPSTTTTIVRPKRADSEKSLVEWLVRQAGFAYGDLRAFFLQHGAGDAKGPSDGRERAEVSSPSRDQHGYALSQGRCRDVPAAVEFLAPGTSHRGHRELQWSDGLAQDDRSQRSNDLAQVPRVAELHTDRCRRSPRNPAGNAEGPGTDERTSGPPRKAARTHTAVSECALAHGQADRATATGGLA